MKVLIFTPEYPSIIKPVRGIFFRELAEGLRSQDIEDVRVLNMHGRMIWPLESLFRRYVNDRITSEDLQRDPEWLLRYHIRRWPRCIGLIQQSRGWAKGCLKTMERRWPGFRPDVIHAQTFIPGAITAQRIAQEWDCPLVITTHGGDTADLIHRAKLRKPILRLAREADDLICVGHSIRDVLVRYGIPSERMTIVYNGMDFSKLRTGDDLLKKQYPGKRVVLAVGNLKHTKGHDLLIQAAHQLHPEMPDLQVVIVGGGPAAAELHSLVQKLGAESYVSLVGPKETSEAMRYVAGCDFFCLPSWSEGFGIAYLEALAHGKPVVAVQGEGISPIVEKHQVGLLIPPKDTPAVAEAIRTFYRNPSLVAEMGARAENLVRNQFSLDHQAKTLLERYRQVIRQAKQKKRHSQADS